MKSSCFILCFLLILSHLQVQIVYKPVDLSKVTSKCGSLGNIHHKPGSPCRRREGQGGGAGEGGCLLLKRLGKDGGMAEEGSAGGGTCWDPGWGRLAALFRS